MVRSLVVLVVLAMGALAPSASPASVGSGGARSAPLDQQTVVATDPEQATTITTERRPATTLEAEDRQDGSSPAPWLIGSALVAGAAVLIGGSLLKRHAR